MDSAYVSALAALAGSVVGAVTSAITTWLNQRSQARAGQQTRRLSQREELFRDFIIAASKMYGEALVSAEPKIEELVALYAMVSRMRVLCQPRTAQCADRVMQLTLDTYYAPNRTIPELHGMVKRGDAVFDPLKDFAEAAREELRSVY